MTILPNLPFILMVKETYLQYISIPRKTMRAEYTGHAGMRHIFTHLVVLASIAGGLHSVDPQDSGREPIVIALAFGPNALSRAHLEVLSLEAGNQWIWTREAPPQSRWASFWEPEDNFMASIPYVFRMYGILTF
jgi:hypothetical protein